MMYQDVKAHLEAVSVLIKELEEANSQVEALHTYGTIMVICKDLRNSAEEYNGTHNIKQVIEEIEGHAAAMADLIPTWSLPCPSILVMPVTPCANSQCRLVSISGEDALFDGVATMTAQFSVHLGKALNPMLHWSETTVAISIAAAPVRWEIFSGGL